MDFLPLLQATAWFSILLIIYHRLIKWADKTKSTRPGPPEPEGRWPVIGHLHLLLGPEPLARKLGDMADRYGPTLMLRIGMRRTLVVSSWEAVKDCFTTNDKALLTRPSTAAAERMGYNYAMIGFAPYGPYWRELRKIAMLQILSNARLEMMKHVRAAEIDMRMKSLYTLWSMNGRFAVPVDLNEWCGDLTMDIVVRMVVGKRCFNGDDDVEARTFQKGHRSTMKATAKELDSRLVKWLDEHRKRRSMGEGEGTKEDFMDVMLSVTENGQMSGYDRDTIIKATCLSLILGGTDTTSVTLARAIGLVLANPPELKKAQEELDIHIGKDRNVDESDITNLVYLQAIVKETLRLAPPAPISIPRQTMQDCQIDGYHVPAGTQVMVNIWKLQQDSRVWSDPCEFRPERFLTSHAGVEPGGQHFEFVPFGSGRRSCPGISFALHVIHLALARVIHGFDLRLPSNAPIEMSRAMNLGAHNSDTMQVMFNPRLSHELY